MEWSKEQVQELEGLVRHAPVPHVRVKAIAVLNVARGCTQREAAGLVCAHREAVGRWVQRYRAQGPAGWSVRAGRGRRPRVDAAEVEAYLRQSPRQFGVAQTRWTLRALASVVPSLGGFTDSGVQRALGRLGFRYKRGQPAVHSPDPEYGEKRGAWTRSSKKPGSGQAR